MNKTTTPTRPLRLRSIWETSARKRTQSLRIVDPISGRSMSVAEWKAFKASLKVTPSATPR